MKIDTFLLPSLTMLVFLAARVASHPLFKDNPYIPPLTFRVLEDGRNISVERGPCPGLNTLANHGFINRNGSDITLDAVVPGAALVLGVTKKVIEDTFASITAVGLRHKGFNGKGQLVFDLFDLFKGGGHDASLVRSDEYFHEYGQFNETLFAMMAKRANKDGLLTYQDVLDHQRDRIIDSRTRNPASQFPWEKNFISRLFAFDALSLFLLSEDDDSGTVRIDYLREFLDENRIPQDFVPRVARGLPLLSNEESSLGGQTKSAIPEVKEALFGQLDEDNSGNSKSQKGVFVGVVLGGVCLAAIVGCVAKKMHAGTTDRNTETEGTQILETTFATRVEVSSEMRRSLVRERVRAMDLSWEGVHVTTKDGTPILLDNTGYCPAGQLTGLLGHSGSGKTTLLSVLGGKILSLKQKSLKVTGKVMIDGDQVKLETFSLGERLAYVTQDDWLVETATPEEAVCFSARMRLPATKTNQYIKDLTDRILEDLQLFHVKNRIMGTSLSGGEKRRVSLGLALVTEPSIFLLDEVTSGLDSYQAKVVVDVCHRLARVRGTAVLMALHQPSLHMLSRIDRMLLLRSGQKMFELPTNDVRSKFLDAGFPVPENFSVSEWALEVSQQHSIAEMKNSGFYEQGPKKIEGSEVDSGSGEKTPRESIANEEQSRISFFREVTEITLRELRHYQRAWTIQMVFLGTITFLSTLYFIFGWQVAQNSLQQPETFASHVGIVFLLVESCIIVMLLQLPEMAKARTAFCHEYSTGHYRLLSYASTKTVVELIQVLPGAIIVMLITYWSVGLQGDLLYWIAAMWAFGCANSAMGWFITGIPMDVSMAHELAPLVMFPQMVFCGYLISFDSLPSYSRWLLWLNPMTYAFRLALGGEFRECTEFTEEEENVLSCVDALQSIVDDQISAYDNSSELVYLQSGTYKGKDSILEYFAYFSVDGVNHVGAMYHDFCPIEGTQVVNVNSVSQTSCEITAADVSTLKINPALHVKHESVYMRAAIGRKYTLEYAVDGLDARVTKEIGFVPEEVSRKTLELTSQTSMAALTCGIFEEACPDQFGANGFSSVFHCIEKMSRDIPFSTTNEDGIVVFSSNSTACRHLHASLAVFDPDLHCPHVSYLPMEDPTGAVKCNKDLGIRLDDLFTDEDKALFAEAARKGGVNTDEKIKILDGPEDPDVCLKDFVDGFGISMVETILPGNYMCWSYLKVQGATGENQFTYWIALVGFYAFFRICSFLLFARKARY